ncbi:hypothetical protein ACVWU4_000884 [Campylobacter coli]
MDNIDVSKFRSLDELLTYTTHTGSIKKAASNMMYGLDAIEANPPIGYNRDYKGFTFFTRPLLNLSTINVANNRDMLDLLTNNPISINRYVRMMLDPRLAVDKKLGGSELTCPLVDNKQAFISILGNNLTSITGFPDLNLPTFTSDEGIRREQWIMVDGPLEIYDSYDLDLKFTNSKDEPIMLLLQTWLKFMSRVYEGMMIPYMDVIVEREICYQTRVYRLITDEHKKFVKKIACANAGFPVNYPAGSEFDYSDNAIYVDSNNEIGIRLKCVGACYNDPILIREFNMVVCAFNPGMGDIDTGFKPKSNMKKVPRKYLNLFNFRVYPRINEDTLELEWYVDSTSKRYEEVVRLGVRL